MKYLHVWESPRGSWNVTVRHSNGRLGPHASGYNRKQGAERVFAAMLSGCKVVNGRPPPEKKRKAMKKTKKKKGGRPC